MGASRRLDTVHKVVSESLAKSSINSISRLFEELDPEWFMDIEHVARLFRFVTYAATGLSPRALEAVRAGDYIVLKPNLRSRSIRKNYEVVESVIAHVARYSNFRMCYESFPYMCRYIHHVRGLLSIEDDLDRFATNGYYEYGDEFAFTIWPLGITLLYMTASLARARGWLQPNPFMWFPAAVIGVDSDTGLLFAETLPPGTGFAALLVEKELRSGSVEAVRAVMGYDYEASDWKGKVGSVVRLQGDLYVRVNAYTSEPRDVAQRIAAVWSAALYTMSTLDDLVSETYRRFKELEREYTNAGLRTLAAGKLAARALEDALMKVYPWALEDAHCILLDECRERQEPEPPAEDDEEDQPGAHPWEDYVNEEDYEHYELNMTIAKRIIQTRIPTPTLATLPPAASTANWREEENAPPGLRYEIPVAFYKIAKPADAIAKPYFVAAIQNVTHPPAVLEMLYLWNYFWSNLPRGDELEFREDVEEYARIAPRIVGNTLLNAFKLLFPRPLREAEDIEELPFAITAVAVSKALTGRPAPESVVNAINAAGERSVVEARVGDHSVSFEGYLLEGPAANAVTVAEMLSDAAMLYYALKPYLEEGGDEGITLLRKSRAADASKRRLAAAKALTRLLMAKRNPLAAVTAEAGAAIEAAHPEHGKAALELPEPALITVTSNPALVYTPDFTGFEKIPSYLRDHI